MEKSKSNNLAVCVICGILTVFGIVASIISLATGSKGIWTVGDAVYLVLSALIVYYAFCGYQKPHGNLLKYTILIFAATRFVGVYLMARLSNPWRAIIAAITIGLCCYVAGRLHRAKQNIILMSVVAVLVLILAFVNLMKGTLSIGGFTPLIIWIDIFVAYILRYKEHKEAGLADAPKKEI